MPLVASPAPLTSTASFPRGVKTEILEAGSGLFRIHHQDNGAIWFGPKPGSPPAYRFDASGGQYRVMYAAASIDGSFVETILHGKAGVQIVSKAFVDLRAWTIITSVRPLTLMKLYDDGLFWHRTDASVSAAHDYTEPRRIALAAYLEDPSVDGLTYRARHDNSELCYALFDRVRVSDLTLGPSQFFREHESERDALMAKYGAIFDTSLPVPRAR